MKKIPTNNHISSEVLASYLDGNASAQECRDILSALPEDDELREVLSISQSVDAELGISAQYIEHIPMTAMAASCNEGNYCCLECEKYILRRLNVDFDEERLLEDAIKNGWQKVDGTALHNVGRHLEKFGFIASRQYKSTIEDIASALQSGKYLIAAIDGGELAGDIASETLEDMFIGEIPDHIVVVLKYDADSSQITIYDPNLTEEEYSCSVEQFQEAWNDSQNYLVTISKRGEHQYNPKSIDLSDVELPDELIELREAIAENAHEVWAENRQAEGWTYGPQRDDENKQHPDMLPYSQLPESEKEYDREMAMKTLKLLRKLGYDIVKRGER